MTRSLQDCYEFGRAAGHAGNAQLVGFGGNSLR